MRCLVRVGPLDSPDPTRTFIPVTLPLVPAMAGLPVVALEFCITMGCRLSSTPHLFSGRAVG